MTIPTGGEERKKTSMETNKQCSCVTRAARFVSCSNRDSQESVAAEAKNKNVTLRLCINTVLKMNG